jgi:uncharacterized protein
MALTARLTSDLTAAMKARDALRTGCLRMAKAALMNKEIDKKAPLDDGEAAKVLLSLVKQREDAAEQFRKGKRPELAEKEEQESAILRSYLPQEVGEAEIAAALDRAVAETAATSIKDMGKVMKATLAALGGRAVDGRKLSDAVRKRLGG